MQVLESVFQDLVRLKLRRVEQYNAEGKSYFADHYFLASADNLTQLEAARNSMSELLKKEKMYIKNPLEEWQGGWCLLDFGNVIIHVLLDEMRSFYDLEGLFSEAEYQLVRRDESQNEEPFLS